MSKLEDWSITHEDSNLFIAPELLSYHLNGIVYGHERMDDGRRVTTSRIVNIDLKTMKANTRNSTYKLGKPSEEYLKWLSDNGKSLESYVINM